MHPLLVNRVIFPLHEWLKGKPTHRRLAELERTQWLSADALRQLQFQRMRRHLEFAYREVPYYGRLLDEHELQPWRIASFEDFARIPCLTRDLLREHFDELQPRTRLRRVQRMSTGGSTGSPVTVLVDSERAAFTDAARLRAHRWYGVDMGVPEIVLWGSPIEITRQDRVRVVRDRLLNSRLLSAFDLGEPALAHYARILRQERPWKLYGYASALYLLACYLRREGWTPEPGWPRVVFTTAEPLYDFQRATIQSVFGCPVGVEYGARDAGLMANECPQGGLHVPAEGMLVEILEGPDHGGELVVTNLESFAMPIIRYRTGDIGARLEAPCPCGRGLPRLRGIEGRRTDFLITPRGKVMHALAMIYILRETPAIREFQVVQDRLDRIGIRIVPDGSLSAATREGLLSRVRRLLGEEVTVDLELVPAMVRPASGKHRHVISTVADSYFDRLARADHGERE
jgi:phenylacetate-CoA ligase